MQYSQKRKYKLRPEAALSSHQCRRLHCQDAARPATGHINARLWRKQGSNELTLSDGLCMQALVTVEIRWPISCPTPLTKIPSTGTCPTYAYPSSPPKFKLVTLVQRLPIHRLYDNFWSSWTAGCGSQSASSSFARNEFVNWPGTCISRLASQ